MPFQDVILWILLIGSLVAVISYIVYQAYDKKRRAKVLEELPLNPVKVINFWPSNANNHVEGYETRGVMEGKDGRIRVSFIPTDLEPQKKDDTKKRVYEKFTMVLDKGHRYPMPKGTFSGEKDYVYYLPPRPEDLDRFGNSPLITALKKYLIDIKNENVTIEAYREGYQYVTETAKAMNTGEMTNLFMEQIKDSVKANAENMEILKKVTNNQSSSDLTRKPMDSDKKGDN